MKLKLKLQFGAEKQLPFQSKPIKYVDRAWSLISKTHNDMGKKGK